MEKDKKTIAQRMIGLRILPSTLSRKFILGLLFLIEGQTELQIGFWFIPKYYVQIVTPLNILWFSSSLFATVYGAISLGIAVVQYFEKVSAS